MKFRRGKMIALLLVLALLAACGSNAASSAPETSAQESEASAASVQEASSAPAEPETPPESGAPEESSVPPAEESVVSEEAEPEFTVTYPLTEEPVTLTMMHPEPALGPLSGRCDVTSYGDVAAINLVNEATGVTIEWNELSMFTMSESFNLVIASGDYPDLICSVADNYAGGMMKAYEDDVIIDLTDCIAEYAPDYYATISADEELSRQTKCDSGQTLATYAIYNYGVCNDGAILRKDWLDQVGMDVPRTIDDLTAAMSAIQSELGVANPIYVNERGDFLAYGFDVAGFDMTGSAIPIYHDGDTVYCSLSSEGYHDYIIQMHEWYESQLINPNYMEFSADLMSGEVEAELFSGRIAIWDGMSTSMTNYYGSMEEGFAAAPSVITKSGENDHITLAARSQGSLSVSTACEHVDLALGWINYWFLEDGITLYNYGVEGDTYEVKDGEYVYTDKVVNNDLGVDALLYCRTFSLAGCAFGYTVQERIYSLYQDYQMEAEDYWTTHSDGTMGIPALTLTTEESEVLASYGTDLVTYASETLPKFINGDLSLDEWDSYLANLESLHLEELTALYQSAYERYLQR